MIDQYFVRIRFSSFLNRLAITELNRFHPASAVLFTKTDCCDKLEESLLDIYWTYCKEDKIRACFLPKAPNDFILNCGASVAFMFVTNWDCSDTSPVFGRVQKLKEQFANLYVVVTLPTKEQNDSFVHSYFRYGMVLGRPMFVLVQDLEMGFEKILKIAHARGVCKRQDAVSKMKAEREGCMQQIDAFLSVVTSIPGIDNHDANALNQAIGSIEAIAKASKELILENTDLSADKAETISRFLRDPKFYLSPKII
ncbi:hypothetical protein RHGRI_023586 [Rhododendron griersonianum]|uniref:Uncharacterized protein n=1 Tax=Rhododendron griersonianum TaxID=479676 RepID=A0AAV6JBA9_9ERIC|nr:hypothetical protein RHGRI_023586 [Rhododendron griersonianum]